MIDLKNVQSINLSQFFDSVKFRLGLGSWYYFGFQYQTYISDIEDTHQLWFGSANSFESYCVHMKSPRKYVRTDRQTEFFFACFVF